MYRSRFVQRTFAGINLVVILITIAAAHNANTYLNACKVLHSTIKHVNAIQLKIALKILVGMALHAINLIIVLVLNVLLILWLRVSKELHLILTHAVVLLNKFAQQIFVGMALNKIDLQIAAVLSAKLYLSACKDLQSTIRHVNVFQ